MEQSMTIALYTATGCARCKIVKKYLQETQTAYQEYDFKAEGKETFAQFYRANRKNIFRDQDGVEFPVFFDGQIIRQGVSVILGYLMAGERLDAFIGRSRLHGEWIDGFDVSVGDPADADQLKNVLSYLKGAGLKIQLTTNGFNADLLETLIVENLCDRVLMEVKGPVDQYGLMTGKSSDKAELMKSIKLATTAPECGFSTVITPVVRENGEVAYLTPEDIGETAALIEEASGSKKHAYTIRPFHPEASDDERFKDIAALPSSALFKYRTAARRYQIMTEIEKPS
jgi:pyruvate-formate lyase-activating enzyme